jgi:hypothetical protein
MTDFSLNSHTYFVQVTGNGYTQYQIQYTNS